MTPHLTSIDADATGPQSTIGVVLAGLHDWSSLDLNERVPRSLAPVVNVPLVMYTLQWLSQSGIRTVVVCANRAGHAFRRLLADGSNLNLSILYHEDRTPRGPAGCARDACVLFPAPQYVIAEANTIPCVELNELLRFHARNEAWGTVVVESEGGTNGHAAAQERPAGVYVFSREALLQASNRGFEDLKESLIPRLYRDSRRVSLFRAGSTAPRVHDTASYLELNRWALSQLAEGDRWQTNCDRKGEALIDASARISNSARLIGRCLVARDACIDDDAVIIGPAILGRGCIIGSASVVRNSVIWDGVEVAPGVVVDGLALSRTGTVSVG